MFLSSRKLSYLQLKSNLYEITMSYAGVRLKNSTGIFFNLEKIVNDFYDNKQLDPRLTICVKIIN